MRQRFWLWALLALVAVGGMWSVGTYNQLTIAKQDTEVQWAQVQTQYQRRFDLLPNLVASVKGYLKHERGILETLAQARQNYAQAKGTSEQIAAATQIDSALSRLLVVVENYPDLKANQTVASLMDEVAGTENRIAVERKRFNEMVRLYNREVQVFPRKILASLFGFQPLPYFEVQHPEAAQPPKIDFES